MLLIPAQRFAWPSLELNYFHKGHERWLRKEIVLLVSSRGQPESLHPIKMKEGCASPTAAPWTSEEAHETLGALHLIFCRKQQAGGKKEKAKKKKTHD